MRLYRIMGAAWAGTQADAKRLAGEHRAPWHETDVPTDKPGLLAWLTERNVAGRPEEIAELEQKRAPLERDPMDVAAGAAVLDQADVDQVNDTRPTFLGKLSADEIERRRMAASQCPKCGNGRSYLHSLERLEVDSWILDRATPFDLDALSALIEEKRK